MSALKDTPLVASERTTADLRFCGEQFESIRSDLIDLTAGLGAAQLAWQPNASTWSIAQCIEHLSIATEVDLRRLATLIALAEATLRFGRAPWSARTSGPVIVLHESGRPSPALGTGVRLDPPECDPDSVVSRFLEINRRLLDLIAGAADRASVTARERSGAILLDLVGHALQLNALHHWRFLLQARRVTEFPSFPRR